MNSHLIFPTEVGKKEIVFRKGMEPLFFLLEIDPYHFYAYWEISPEELSIIIDQTGDFFLRSQLILRVYEGNNLKSYKVEMGSYFDILVEGWKNKWYVEISNSNASYYAELGLKLSTLDDLYLIKRSNVIMPPQNIIFSNKREQWMQILGEYEEVKIVKNDQVSPKVLSTHRTSVERKIIEEYYADLCQKHWQGISPAPGNDQRIGQEEPVNRPKFTSEDKPVFFPEVQDQVKTENFTSHLPFSSYNLSSEIPSSFSSFSILSSWQPEEKTSPNRFFQYGTDLVIYGKTQPKSVLYIDGDKVEIRPDGTFSRRLNLSREGDYRIPLRVVLQGGEEIWESIPFHIQKVKKSGD